jgi:hypothetical protein
MARHRQTSHRLSKIYIPQASDFYVELAAVSARSTSGALMRSLNALSPFFIKANHND